uniref:(northern house mosquito) hypothetical protein n=1 Tax=Culex pipiens TaxID=7175 RepID=A0A8D8BPB7_CULPI
MLQMLQIWPHKNSLRRKTNLPDLLSRARIINGRKRQNYLQQTSTLRQLHQQPFSCSKNLPQVHRGARNCKNSPGPGCFLWRSQENFQRETHPNIRQYSQLGKCCSTALSKRAEGRIRDGQSPPTGASCNQESSCRAQRNPERVGASQKRGD